MDGTDEVGATPARLSHTPANFGQPGGSGLARSDVAVIAGRPPALVLTAEGPRRADLLAWATAHRERLAQLRLLAPAGVAGVLAEHGLTVEALRSGTVGPAATAGLAAAGVIDGMVAFSDPIELRPGDTTTRSLSRLAIFWDIPIAANRATADILLNRLTPATPAARTGEEIRPDSGTEPVRGAVRLWHIRATVDDVPGRLAILAASLARRAINILSVQVYLTSDGPVDELLVAASPVLTEADLSSAVVDGGARSPQVSPADAHNLVDAPTRALALASRLVRTPDDLPTVLTSLLVGSELRWRPEPPAGYQDDPTQLWLDDPTGGGFLLSRPAAPFTPAESARAQAMVELAVSRAAIPEPEPASTALLLGDGTELTVRRAAPEDLDKVLDLHARCSATARLRRYLGGTTSPSPAVLARLLSPTTGHSLAVEGPDGGLVAMANLIWRADGADLAVLVEDGWQQRRIGTVLARRLATVAAEAGIATIRTVVHTGNTPMIRIMAGIGQRLHREYEGGLLTLIATVRPVGRQIQRSSHM